MADVELSKKIVTGGIMVVNGEEMLRGAVTSEDFLKKLLDEVKDYDAKECQEIADAVKLLDLLDDGLEAKVEAGVQAGSYWAPYISQFLKLILPKIQQTISTGKP